ncbi:UTP--glucose-1-phosphate uridylyltransferase [Abditibacteriota bacterium]|nr:UTP--glucose-1-phosphate uridylyltransferase [Abditibacteriota bacterium]
MKAMILAAGVGSRLDPITRTTPKPMVPVLGLPVIEHIIRLLEQHGFDEIICNTHYLAEQIESYFAHKTDLKAKVSFNREEKLLGTAGGLKRVQDQLGLFTGDEPFLVVGGDDLTSVDLSAMLAAHREKGALATIALTEVEDPSQFGVVVLGENDAIERFVEKPKPGTAPSNLVNMGVYLFSPRILDKIPSGEFYDFGKQVFPQIQEAGEPFFGFKSREYWRDVGNLREYRDVQGDFFTGEVALQTGLTDRGDGVWLGENVQIAPDAKIEAPCAIGAHSQIGTDAQISGGSVLGQGVMVGAGAIVENSILWDGAQIGDGAHLVRCIVGRDCSIQSNAGVFDAVIVPSKVIQVAETLEK